MLNNLMRDPKKLRLYGLASCHEIEPAKQVDFYGTIYAPNALVQLKKIVTFHGAIAAKSFISTKQLNLNYDASIQGTTIDGTDTCFRIKHWSE